MHIRHSPLSRSGRLVLCIWLVIVWCGAPNVVVAQRTRAPSASTAPSAEDRKRAAADMERAFAALEAAVKDIPRDTFKQLEALQSSIRASDINVAAKAAELGPNVAAAFRFVRDDVRFEAYEGVLRGPRGTLMARAGNAFDKSMLLAELLRHHGVEVRFKIAMLDQARADMLATATYGRGAVTAGERRAGAAPVSPDLAAAAQGVSDAVAARFFTHVNLVRNALETGRVHLGNTAPVSHETLVEEARRHCWIEYRRGKEWIALDPSPGPSAPQPADQGLTQAELPATSFHRVVIRVRVEERSGNDLKARDILRHEATAAQLNDAAVALEHTLTTTNQEWVATPVLTIDGATITGEALRGQRRKGLASDLEAGAKGLGDRILTGMGAPAKRVELAAVWLEIDFGYPSGRSETVQREIFDRLGPAVRLARTERTARLADLQTLGGVPAPLVQFFALSFSAGPLHPALTTASLRSAALQAAQRKLPLLERHPGGISDADLNDIADVIPDSLRMLAQSFHVHSALARRMLENDTVRYYEATPRLAIASLGFGASQDGRRILLSRSLDLRRNEVRTVGRGQPGRDFVWANVLRGVLDGVVEHTIAGELSTTVPDGAAVLSPVSIIERAQSGASMVTMVDVNTTARLDVPSPARARLAIALKRGAVAITPARAITVDGEPRIGWWSVHPVTGETLSVMDTGLHQTGSEKETLDPAWVWAIQMMNSRICWFLLRAIAAGDVVVRTRGQDMTRTAVAIGGGIIAVLSALFIGYHWGGSDERDRQRREEWARRPPAPEG